MFRVKGGVKTEFCGFDGMPPLGEAGRQGQDDDRANTPLKQELMTPPTLGTIHAVL